MKQLTQEDIQCQTDFDHISLAITNEGIVIMMMMPEGMSQPMALPLAHTKDELAAVIATLIHFHDKHYKEGDSKSVAEDLINRSKNKLH